MSDLENKTRLGIDYGERRIGIAKSDPLGIISSALTTLEVKSQEQALDKIKGLIDEYQPVGLVVGYPLMPSGDKSVKCEAVDRFVAKLREFFDGPIDLVDERYSSTEAAGIIHAHGKRTGQDKRRIDRLAAVIILQRYLDEEAQ